MWKSSLILVAVLALAALGDVAEAKQLVCVIGTGPAGLTAAKMVAEHPDEFEVVTFEKSSDVGGLWRYTDSTTVDEHGLPVHSSLYKYLRTNVPKELMEFPDYREFKGENVSYVRHDTVLQYLTNYTEHFNLRRHILFNHNVEKVLPLRDLKWLAIARDLNTQKVDQVLCDAVMVGSGHQVKGNIPKIAGIERFTGQVIHSHLYRKPQAFANKTVLVLGASFSGQELAVHISQYATKVYLSHRHDKLSATFPSNVEQVLGVKGAEGEELILSDGSRFKVDVLLLATGYAFNFPFLTKSSGIKVKANGKHVVPLYKHLININRPTMAILNIPGPRLAFAGPHAQVAYFIAVLRGKVTLPSRKEMLRSAKLPAGCRESDAHVVKKEIFQHYDDLATAAGYETLPPWFSGAFDEAAMRIFADPLHFRQNNLVIYGDRTFKFVHHNEKL